MHTNVHCSTVYNSKDLEPTQMPINDRLDRKNVAHIHHGILCSHKKWWVHVLPRDMDESGNHHSQQTDTRTENQTPPVLIHREVLNKNTWTQVGEHHTLGSVGEAKGGPARGRGGWEGITWGEMPDVGDRRTEAANHFAIFVSMQQSCRMQDVHLYPKAQSTIIIKR